MLNAWSNGWLFTISPPPLSMLQMQRRNKPRGGAQRNAETPKRSAGPKGVRQNTPRRVALPRLHCTSCDRCGAWLTGALHTADGGDGRDVEGSGLFCNRPAQVECGAVVGGKGRCDGGRHEISRARREAEEKGGGR